MAHGEVKDEIVERVYRRVMDGMGMVVLHSGHASKIMQKLMGTNSGELKWREIGEKEILWAVSPSHPILRGLPECSAAACATSAGWASCSISGPATNRSPSIIKKKCSRF